MHVIDRLLAPGDARAAKEAVSAIFAYEYSEDDAVGRHRIGVPARATTLAQAR
jgi:hypothetical protein